MYLITSDNNEPGTLDTLPKTKNLVLVTESEFLNSDDILLDDGTRYAITTEGIINTVTKKTISKNKEKATNLLKDKVLFRRTIASIFTDYDFFNIKISELPSLKINKKMIVKPRKGFFGTGVRVIDKDSNLKTIKEEIVNEITKNSKAFTNSGTILTANDLIIEDYIEGEEYAVDMFYDDDGNIQLLNIYYHPIPKNEAYIHALYCSSKNIYEKIAPKAIEIFTKLNETLQVKNYVIHAEFKLDGDRLIPIEMNPMRLGGMGLGNMSFYALGVNPYEYIIKGQAPKWQEIWNKKEHQDAVYNFLIAYNGTDVDVTTQKPNINKMKENLGIILNETHFDYTKNLVFGIFTTKETEESFEKLKSIEFNDFFE